MITLDSPWRRLGAFPIATWRDEFRRVGSPMLPDADACVEAAGPHGALALAQAFVEDKYATTGSKPQAKNPLNLRPGPGRMTPTVTVPGKGEFLSSMPMPIASRVAPAPLRRGRNPRPHRVDADRTHWPVRASSI